MTPNPNNAVTRRDALKAGGAIAAGALLARCGAPGPSLAPESTSANAPARSLRIAHLSDMHIQPERRAGEGVAACLRHLAALRDQPDLVITGGDLVMDAFERGEARARTQWDLLLKTLRDGCGARTYHCLGNHDIWGWDKAKSGTTGAEPAWGKKWAQDALGLASPYYSFDEGAWRFIVLDSVHRDGADGYIGRLDDAQFDWLERTLRDTSPGRSVCVVSHIPILAACALFDARNAAPLSVRPGALMTDAHRIHPLLARHAVRLCLSGHIHQLDRVEYDGVTYLCDGAVCANWWKGRYKGLDEGYGVVDLRDDGSFTHEYVRYGWQALQD